MTKLTKTMAAQPLSEEHTSVRLEIERQLLTAYGPLIGGDNLRRVLGFQTAAAFLQAATRGTLPIPVFPIANRKGKFALARDIATWLAALREAGSPTEFASTGAIVAMAAENATKHDE
jgi:hypothetical protein